MPWWIPGECGMSKEIVRLTGDLSSMRAHLSRMKIKNFSPVMARIRDRYMRPMARRSWAASGLNRISGELKAAITPFAGKRSSGVGLRTWKGRDLVLAKAVVHTYGKKKHEYHRRRNRKKSPWGDIPARPFMPSGMPVGYRDGSECLIVEFINDRV